MTNTRHQIPASTPAGTEHLPVLRPSTVLACTIVGSLLFLAGQAALPVLPFTIEEAYGGMVDHRGQLMASRLLTSAGCFLLVVLAAGLWARPGSTSRTVRAGALMVGVGAFFNGVAQAVQGYATYVATGPGVAPDSGRVVIDKVTAGALGLPLSFASVPVFALGCLVVAAGLFVSRAVPPWLPLLLAVGTLMAGALAGRGPIVALTQAPATAALIVLAHYAFTRWEPTRPSRATRHSVPD